VEERQSDPRQAVPASDLEQEIAALYDRHSGELRRFAGMILRPRDGASDAVQETFLRYFAERRCGGTIDNPRAWLYRVLHNYLMDRLDRASVKREIPAEGTEEPLDTAQDPEELIVRSQTARQIVAGLTSRELDCLLLRAEGLSYEQVAEELGVRCGTVGALLTRVHKKLQLASGDSRPLRLAIAAALGSLLGQGGTYSP
jgi:RNA polymerase sigma-70 factor (ECF subfamily)